MVKRRKKNKLLNSITVFVVVSLFSWLVISGIIKLLESKGWFNSPFWMIGLGLAGLFISGLLGWKKFK